MPNIKKEKLDSVPDESSLERIPVGKLKPHEGERFTIGGQIFVFQCLEGDKAKVALMKQIEVAAEYLEIPADILVNKI